MILLTLLLTLLTIKYGPIILTTLLLSIAVVILLCLGYSSAIEN
jgi:hypothetical protein